MIRAYLFALDPTEAQAEAFRSHCGAQRFAYNWGLDQIKANLGQREAERSYGIAEDDLTPPVSWSAYSLRRAARAEPGQGRGCAVVGGQLEGGVLVRPGQPVHRTHQLARVENRQA